MNRRRGFSLVEIVIVTGILTLIVGLVVLAFARAGNAPKAVRFLQLAKVYAGYIREAAQNNAGFRGQLPVTRTGSGGVLPLGGLLALSANAAVAERAISFDLVMTGERMLESFGEIPYGGVARPAVPVRWDSVTRTFWASPDVAASVAAVPAAVVWQRIESRLSDPSLSPELAQGANFQSAPSINLPPQVVVVYWRLPAVPQALAEEMARRANKPEYQPAPGTAARIGPVAYAAPVGGFTDVYLYIYHQ